MLCVNRKPQASLFSLWYCSRPLGCGNHFSGKALVLWNEDKCCHGYVMEDLVGKKLEGLQREVHECRGDLGFYSTLCKYGVQFHSFGNYDFVQMLSLWDSIL